MLSQNKKRSVYERLQDTGRNISRNVAPTLLVQIFHTDAVNSKILERFHLETPVKTSAHSCHLGTEAGPPSKTQI